MSTPAPQNWRYLERRPGSFYRQLYIKGIRISARDLYGWYMADEGGMTAEQLAEEFSLPLEAVLEAIAYCETNPPEIENDFRREEALMDATGMNDPDYKYHQSPKSLSPQEYARIFDLYT
jgi:uncharacterized protein (DUF433 family)